MDVWEAIERRNSVRAYLPDPVPEESLERVMEAGRRAPSAFNRQPWHFVVVKDDDGRAELSRTAPYGKFVKEAPVAIVGCGDAKGSPDWYMVDTSIAMQQMVIMATAEGLGTCWVGKLDKDEIRRMLSIPDDWEILAILTIGYPRKKLDLTSKLARSGKRKDLDKVFSSERFGEGYQA
jgi:nitroreductase